MNSALQQLWYDYLLFKKSELDPFTPLHEFVRDLSPARSRIFNEKFTTIINKILTQESAPPLLPGDLVMTKKGEVFTIEKTYIDYHQSKVMVKVKNYPLNLEAHQLQKIPLSHQ